MNSEEDSEFNLGERRLATLNLSGNYLFYPLFAVVIALCLIISYRAINVQSTFTLGLFTFLFATLTFRLAGTAIQKLAALTVGNVLGLIWNFVFSVFSSAGAAAYGKPFTALYSLMFPFLTLMWVVPFWAISLSLLPKPTTEPTKS